MIYVDLSSLQILSQLEPLRPQLYALLVICLCLCPCLNVTAILSCLPLAAWMLRGWSATILPLMAVTITRGRLLRLITAGPGHSFTLYRHLPAEA